MVMGIPALTNVPLVTITVETRQIFSLDYRQLHALKLMTGKMLLFFAGLLLFRDRIKANSEKIKAVFLRIKADFVRINKEIN